VQQVIQYHLGKGVFSGTFHHSHPILGALYFDQLQAQSAAAKARSNSSEASNR
jgi:hypothetical protein